MLANRYYAPHKEIMHNLHLDILADQKERDDNVATLYQKSLLYFIANALEADARFHQAMQSGNRPVVQSPPIGVRLKGGSPMLALETTASIADHRLVIQDAALPAHAERARVIVLWESAKPAGHRSPPPALAGMGEEKGDLLGGPPESDWEALT